MRYSYGTLSTDALGLIVIVQSASGLRQLATHVTDVDEFVFRWVLEKDIALSEDYVVAASILTQIERYLAGERFQFNVELDLQGLTPFQAAALRAACEIPYGETRSYGEIAAQIGHVGAARAVGAAMRISPISIVLPCHRVIGAGGKLGGYGSPADLQIKAWLLKLEGSLPQK